jgi:hypothetical protein
MKMIRKSLICKAAAFSLLAAIVVAVLLAGDRTPASQAASSYPFPGRAEDLNPGEYWHLGSIHAGQVKSLDLTGIRFSEQTGQWTYYKEDNVSADDDYNEDFILYNKKVHAIADGEVIACWRNAPNNIRPGDISDGGTPHPGRVSSPRTIATAGNFLVVKTSGENRTVLYAHLKPGSIPQSVCPRNQTFMDNADNKYDPVAQKYIEYPIESVLPEGNRPTIKEGQIIGRVGNVGASSGPHLHIDMSDIVGPNDEGPSLPINFDGGWVQQRTPGVNISDDDWQLLNGQELDSPPQVILPSYTSGWVELAKHGVPASDFKFTFSHIKHSGYRPVWIDGYEVNGNNFFNAIFRPADGTTWSAKFGLNSEQYQDEFDLRIPQGYRPLQVESYPDGNTVRYAVIFVQEDGPLSTAYHGVSAAQHQAAFNLLFDQGYIPRNVSVVSLGVVRYYTAYYEKVSFGSLIAHSFLTPGEYQTQSEANAAVGRDLVYVNAYNHSGGVRFSAIWKSPTPGVSISRHDKTTAGYQDEYEHWTGLGYLTRCVTGYEDNNGARFAALWR